MAKWQTMALTASLQILMSANYRNISLMIISVCMPMYVNASISSETVDGISWTYQWSYQWDYSVVGGGLYYPAIPQDTTGVITIPRTFHYNKTVKTVASYAFEERDKITEVNIPYAIEEIGSYAFRNCYGLKTINLPSSLKRIRKGAFSGCSGLNAAFTGSLYVWCGISFDDSTANPLYYAHNLYVNGDMVSTLTLPERLTDVGAYAFYGCTNIINITIPNSVTNIGTYAFDGYESPNRIVTFLGEPPNGIANSKIIESAAKIFYRQKYADSFADIIPTEKFGGYPLVDSEYVNEQDFSTGGDKGWEGIVSLSSNGIRNGRISHNESSWLEITIGTPGRISFWWKSSSEEYDGDVFDYAFLSLDGVPQGSLDNYHLCGVAIGGQRDWTNVIVDVVGEGAHTIRWTYQKDNCDESDVGDDCVWLGGFSFIPKPTISFGIGANAKGNAPNSIQDLTGAEITLPNGEGFSWTDHVFNGWTDGRNSYDGGANYTIPSSNVTLTAMWTAKSFLTFDIGGGEGLTPELIKALPKDIVTLPTDEGFYWTDHVFDGWTDGRNSYSGGGNYTIPSSNVTLTAKWIAKSFLTFDIGGGEGSTPDLIRALPNTIVTLPTDSGFAWSDHVFDGWNDGVNDYAGGADYIVPSSNVTLTAHWLAKSFVSFDIGEGTGDVPETIKDLPNAIVELPTDNGFSWSDHVFIGWDLGNWTYEIGTAEWNNFPVPSSNVTLTAHWLAKSFVSFDIGNGTGEPPQMIKGLPDEIVSLPTGEGLTLTDYAFGGWADGAANYVAGGNYIVPETNVTLTAVWIAKRFLTFTLDGGDGEIPITIKDVPNATVTLPSGEGLSKPKYTFVGWNDGTQTYEAGAEYLVTDTSIEFTAVWAANTLVAPVIASADVANGGTIETESATIEISAEDGTTIYYTMDGTEPTTNSTPYTVPFTVDGLSVTIKAFAVKDNYFDSGVAEFSFYRKPYSAAECLNADGKTVSTGGNDTAWVRVLGDEAHDGTAALRSGAIGDGESSSIEMTVDGAGEIGYWWKSSSEISRNRKFDYVSFLIDGVEQSWLGGEKDWTNEVYAVGGEGTHTLKWVYTKNDNGLTQGEDCAWLDEVKWTPWREITTKQTAVPIPYGWLDSHGLLANMDAETAAKQPTGKRDGSGRLLTVEDDFIAGTDPTDASDIFTVSIAISNGVPVIEWKPNLNTNGENRVYTIYGKESLSDEDWITPTNALCRFFKVGVAMPTANENNDSTGGSNGGDEGGSESGGNDSGDSNNEGGSDNSGSGDTGSNIPLGYSTNDVQCVSCTGSEWYDLGLPPTLTMKTQIKCSFAGENEHMAIIGVLPPSYNENDKNDYRLFIASSPFEWFLDFPDSSRIRGASAALNEIREVEFGNFYVKDLATDSMLISGSTVTAPCPSHNLRLFRTNYYSPSKYTTGSVYYVRIYDLNASNEYELVRNLVPCKSDSDEVGLLDLVEKKFYKSDGTSVSVSE